MSASRYKKNSEGRVNVPLGPQLSELEAESAKVGTTKTYLGRMLIIDGLDRLKSGDFQFKPASIQPKEASV